MNPTTQKYMNVLKYNLIIVLFFLFIGCSERPTDEKYLKMSEDINRFYGIKMDKTAECLIFINDRGCPNCITSFSNYVLNNIDKYRDNSFIFINSTGWNVDIERFASMNLKNIIISRNVREQGEIIPDLGFVYMTETRNKIDTVISMTTEKFLEQIDYIEKRN